MSSNVIKKYDLELHWKILFWISLKNMILNVIERYNLEFYEKYIKILITLTSILSLNNRSLIISMFSFSTAKYNAVL